MRKYGPTINVDAIAVTLDPHVRNDRVGEKIIVTPPPGKTTRYSRGTARGWHPGADIALEAGPLTRDASTLVDGVKCGSALPSRR
jgi:hypothetical protein